MAKKLYRVTCRGMTTSIANEVKHGIAYVVADNPDEAYKKLRESLDRRDLGFAKDRELEKVELIAEETDYPHCGLMLFA